MNPLALLSWLAGQINAARLSEPVRLWLYGLGSLIAGALVLAGWITDEWSTFGLLALAQLLAVPAGELARLSVYAPRTLLDAGVLREVSPDVPAARGLEPGRHAAPEPFAAPRSSATPTLLRQVLTLVGLTAAFALTCAAVTLWCGPLLGLDGIAFVDLLSAYLTGSGVALVAYGIMCGLWFLARALVERARALRTALLDRRWRARRQPDDLVVTAQLPAQDGAR